MTTDFSFARRSLISNESKYRQSLEYRMFLAENPDMVKNSSLPNSPRGQPQSPSILEYDNQIQQSYGMLDYPVFQPERMAATFDAANNFEQKTLLNRQKQFLEYAPEFASKLDQVQVGPQSVGAGLQQKYASTLPTQASSNLKSPSIRDSRWARDEPRSVGRKHVAYDDINDRDDAFNLDSAVRNDPQIAALQYPQRQAVSAIRNNAGPRSQLISSAKLQIGKQVPQTLHNTSALNGLTVENPLIGYSEGERVKREYRKQFMNYALSQAEGSIQDVKERSRSKSRRARLEAARRRAQEEGEASSFVDLINRSRALSNANRIARQRSGSPNAQRLGSPDLVRLEAGGATIQQTGLDQNITLNDATAAGFQQRLGQPGIDTVNLTVANRVNQTRHLDTTLDASLGPDILQREQAKAEYKAQLLEQINEKKEKERLVKQQEADYEQRMMSDYANYYRIGALKQGGGSPIRNREGEIISQHVPFSSQSQQNGGIEQADETFNDRNQNYAQQMQSSYVNAFGTKTAEVEPRKTMAGTYSPKKQEIMHMKPSNMFEDITEDEFNKREQEKRAYQNLLMDQMNEAKERKQQEKDRIRRQEVEDERKIYAQLDQMREAFRKEENPDEKEGNYRSVSQASGEKSNQRAASNERPESNLNLQPVAPPSSYQQDNSFNIPIREPYHSPFDQQNLSQASPSNYNQSVQDQLDKLRRVQEEIDQKNNLDRIETEKIFRDLLDSNRRFQSGIRSSDISFDARNLPNSISAVNDQMSGNIRLESQFTRIEPTPAIAAGTFNALNVSGVGAANGEQYSSVGPTTETDGANQVGTLSSNMANTLDNRSAINRLEDLIDDFQKPEERLDER